MELAPNPAEELRAVLKNMRNPGALDDHPWTGSLIVRESLAKDARSRNGRPGQQLVDAIAGLFTDMQPLTPPRRGKRLDPRWGEFGLLAALYFTPYKHGIPYPTTLLEAWKRIDAAILYYVFGKPAAFLSQEQIQRYRLVGEELDYGSTSTLSDWHKKGLQRLADILANRERFLSSGFLDLEPPASSPVAAERERGRRSVLWLAPALFLCILLLVGARLGWGIYNQGLAALQDLERLEAQLPTGLQAGEIEAAYPDLLALKGDLAALEDSAGPLIRLGPALGWLPAYGGDLAALPELSRSAVHLVEAADLGYQAAAPLLEEMGAQPSRLEPASLTALLVSAQPALAQARLELDRALEARRTIDPARLSPRLQVLVTEKLDPALERADDSLKLATALPVVLGATPEGPKTYLLLAQNEDELRSTGGFITSVGRLVVHNGQVLSLDFEPVDNQEDWSKPYPPAPWQMREYMNSPIVLLRDANWSPDFPASAQMAETLYAYNHDLSVDGVIAFDQHFLVMLLGQLGPLEVQDAPGPVTAENVIPYMRASKRLAPGESAPAGWSRKAFIPKITTAILGRLVSGEGHDWRALAAILARAVEERHLLLQFDDPQVTALLARRGWQNALDPGSGDFLLVTATNMGFNKTNALVEQRLSYVVDLTDPAAPRAELAVSHTNRASPDVPCVQWNTGQIVDGSPYPMDRCYWSYLRVYKQAGAELAQADPRAVPGEWMMLGRQVPARVDVLEEDLPGVQGYGTFSVLPGGQSWETHFQFALPPGTLSQEPGTGAAAYRLKVQKQPGTLAVPLEIRILLPPGTVPVSAPDGSAWQGNELSLTTDLRTDVQIELVFELP